MEWNRIIATKKTKRSGATYAVGRICILRERGDAGNFVSSRVESFNKRCGEFLGLRRMRRFFQKARKRLVGSLACSFLHLFHELRYQLPGILLPLHDASFDANCCIATVID